MTTPLLQIQDLCINFKSEGTITTAVKHLSFDIPKGKTVGLVGESGSGKSVTSLAIMGLIPSPPGEIAQGKILFEGTNLLELRNEEMRRIRGNKISMIFQEPMTSLNPVFTLGNQVDEAIMLHQSLSRKEAREKTLELFHEMGLPRPADIAKSYPHQISGGQKQRVMIAMAMACKPALLICDEPTTALDVTIQKQVLELMQDLKQRHQMSMLFITHDLSVVAEIADEVVVMFRGELVERDSKRNVFLRPGHPYTKGLLACRPKLEGNPERLMTVEQFLVTDAGAGSGAGTETVSGHALQRSPVVSAGSGPSENILLEVKNLKKYFPIKGGLLNRTHSWVKAVDDVSFTVRKGTTLGLVGESGCGKTTLGRTLIRLIEPSSGEVYFNGENISQCHERRMRELRKKIQIIFQDPYSSLNPRLTVGEIVSEPMKIHRIFKRNSEMMDRVGYLLDKVGLNRHHLKRYPHEFSGGQRQRICLARALALGPEFIICDESVSSLDVSIQAQVLNLLLDLQDEMNLTYIFISHDLNVVKFISDQVGVMKEGRIIELAEAEEIYRNPQNSYTRELLDAIPKGNIQ